MCIVCIANNINRNVYMYLNARIFTTSGYARVRLFIVYKAKARRNGYRMFTVKSACLNDVLVCKDRA